MEEPAKAPKGREVHDWQSGVGYEQVWKDTKWEREADAM